MSESKLRTQSMDFAVSILNLVKTLKEKKEYIISNQIGRSGTSIGANIREAQYAHGKPDFIAKLQIALKEANETGYWLELLYKTNYIDEQTYKSLDSACGLNTWFTNWKSAQIDELYLIYKNGEEYLWETTNVGDDEYVISGRTLTIKPKNKDFIGEYAYRFALLSDGKMEISLNMKINNYLVDWSTDPDGSAAIAEVSGEFVRTK